MKYKLVAWGQRWMSWHDREAYRFWWALSYKVSFQAQKRSMRISPYSVSDIRLLIETSIWWLIYSCLESMLRRRFWRARGARWICAALGEILSNQANTLETKNYSRSSCLQAFWKIAAVSWAELPICNSNHSSSSSHWGYKWSRMGCTNSSFQERSRFCCVEWVPKLAQNTL